MQFQSNRIFPKVMCQHMQALTIACALVWCFVGISSTAKAQNFSGYKAGNYTGVNGAFFNPSSIADSRYRWDFNLISVSASAINSNASYKLSDFGSSFDGDGFVDQLAGANAGPISALVNLDIHGPSVMFNTGRKTSFALLTRVRTMAKVDDIDARFFKEISDDEPTYPYTFNLSGNQKINFNAWQEIGVTWGQVIAESDRHQLKGGLTLKYLGGALNGHIQANNLSGTLNEDLAGDTYLNNAGGRLAFGFAGQDLENFEVQDAYSFENSGLGADLGLTFEIKDKKNLTPTARDENKYKFKFGVALLDIGSMTYAKDPNKTGAYTVNITGAETFNFNAFEDIEIDKIKQVFDDNPNAFTPDASNNASEVKVSLPTRLYLSADYHIAQGFYINLDGQISMVSNDENKTYNPAYFNNFSVTPRFEGKGFGVYVPIAYNEISELAMGACIRLGPLFIGSGSVLSGLLGSSKQVDAYMGLRFGGLHNKSSRNRGNKTIMD